MLKKKIFLTSAFAVCIACPAFAVDGNDLIENGDTCNNTNLGTYEGTANVEAIWTIDPRTCTAGQSYDSTTNTCITCTAGNYCPGGTFNVNSETNGLNACPSRYALSESGAGADTDCYRQCATTDVAHSTGVSGGYYYGDNNQCSATSCASGWHLKPGLSLDPSTSPTNSAIGFYRGNDYVGVATYHEPAYYNIEGQGEWGIDMGYGVIHGIARCSTVQGDNNSYQWTDPTTFANLTDETGQEGARYCYCQMDAYKPSAGDWQSASSAWVFRSDDYDSADFCAYYCALDCASYVGSSAGFRGALFGSIAPSLASCEANNIALKWYNDNTEVVPANSAAEQCTYNETITIPTNEPTKTGYTFGGWKLRTTTQN